VPAGEVIRLSSADGGAGVETAEAEPEPTPTDEGREALVESLRAELGDALVDSHIRVGDDLWVRVTRDAWRAAGDAVKHKLGCTYFDFLSAIDWLPSPFGRDMDSQEDITVHGAEPKAGAEMATGFAGGDTRIQVFARVASVESGHALTLKVDLPDDDPTIATWVPVYAGANWHERETWEMFGVTFVGHPHLVHMYLPGAFEGYPLRKDFPLLARRVKPWPGIVDVEAMPGGDDDEDEASAEEGSAE
jgi:NADH-quinone oxidoreductase subunit C